MANVFLPWSSVGEEARRTLSRHGACAHTFRRFGADSVLARVGGLLFHRCVRIAFLVSMHNVCFETLLGFLCKTLYMKG